MGLVNSSESLYLLKATSLISSKYEAIAKESGANFNVFQILDVETREVKTHSRFLAELLNPNGLHGQGTLFLECFLSEIDYKISSGIKPKVELEKFIGGINSDYTSGGFIDILISFGDTAIIIENKIFAGDQTNQLLRYSNYAKANFNDHIILYLTLKGDESSNLRVGSGDVNYICISYRDQIKRWISKCQKEAANLPVVRETLKQYLQLINKLTDQTIEEKMKDELADLIARDQETLKAFFDLGKPDVASRTKLILFEKLKKDLIVKAEVLGLDSDFREPGYLKFHFRNSGKGFYLSFCFCQGYDNLVFQAHARDEVDLKYKQDVINALGERGKQFNEIWIRWMPNEIRFWENDATPWIMILNGQMAEVLGDQLKSACKKLEGLQL